MTQNMIRLGKCRPYTPISLTRESESFKCFLWLWLFCPLHVDHQLQGLILFLLFCADLSILPLISNLDTTCQTPGGRLYSTCSFCGKHHGLSLSSHIGAASHSLFYFKFPIQLGWPWEYPSEIGRNQPFTQAHGNGLPLLLYCGNNHPVQQYLLILQSCHN